MKPTATPPDQLALPASQQSDAPRRTANGSLLPRPTRISNVLTQFIRGKTLRRLPKAFGRRDDNLLVTTQRSAWQNDIANSRAAVAA